MKLTIDDRYIHLEEICNASSVQVSNDAHFEANFLLGHTFLMNEIKKGKPIYGVTTGYGASGKNYLTYEQSAILQQNLYRFHGCGVGASLSPKTSRYALICRLISLSKGKSGISYALL